MVGPFKRTLFGSGKADRARIMSKAANRSSAHAGYLPLTRFIRQASIPHLSWSNHSRLGNA
jgi:hypothetical protein